MKYLLLFVFALSLNACGPRTWNVAEYPDGGTIAYSGEGGRKAAEQAIPCVDWELVSDMLKSGTETYTSYETVRTTSTTSGAVVGHHSKEFGQTTESSTEIPVTRSYTREWRELTYKCKKTPVLGTQTGPEPLPLSGGKKHKPKVPQN